MDIPYVHVMARVSPQVHICVFGEKKQETKFKKKPVVHKPKKRRNKMSFPVRCKNAPKMT